ncbi:unnamed protein product [Durusdinium trenchii]|uniref:Uncharacterized protein n=1 Tax=Durusdinium trenchii TaxID=1381693 RepID=A0ABP0IC25_9DINO
MAARNPISAEYQEHVMKYLPAMWEPEFNLSRAADYLESWLQGTLSLQPPLELSELRLPDQYRKAARAYLERAIFQAAAKIWAEGVPWPEAKQLATKALEKAYPHKGKGKGKGKGKRKGKG